MAFLERLENLHHVSLGRGLPGKNAGSVSTSKAFICGKALGGLPPVMCMTRVQMVGGGSAERAPVNPAGPAPASCLLHCAPAPPPPTVRFQLGMGRRLQITQPPRRPAFWRR